MALMRQEKLSEKDSRPAMVCQLTSTIARRGVGGE